MIAKELAEELMKHPESEVLVCCDHAQENTRAYYVNYSPFMDYGDELKTYDEDWSADDAGFESEQEWQEVKKNNRVFVIS